MAKDTSKQERKVSQTYFPPANLILSSLGITLSDLESTQVNVVAAGLRKLILELAKRFPFDEDSYRESNPDVEGARISGDIGSLHQHFVEAGYFEGRLPCEPACDPEWYRNKYEDIAASFRPSETDRIKDHFLSKGYFEGRAGTRDDLAAAEGWQQLTSD